ncbi:MAG: sensor histidine kinase [Algicola sp.]|nr:sensor histidine kinase [Algicola sp.]
MIALLKKINARLLPPGDGYHYSPYVWLAYLFFFFFSYFAVPHTIVEHLSMVAGILMFLALYFNVYWIEKSRVKFNIIGIVVVASLMTILSQGSSVLFVYAGAFCCKLGSPRKAVMGLISIALWITALSLVFSLSKYFYLPGGIFTLVIGALNIYQYEIDAKRKELKLSQQEVKQLAKTAERERIARDLHDLIGHTFSVITLKADLAGKLIDKDSERAKKEIKELENISRNALSQVREVVTGFRTSDLNAELASAKYLLQSNDIDFNYSLGELTIDEHTNKELAIIFKELTTNIIKHAKASKVTAAVEQDKNGLRLNVTDNGKGMATGSSDGYGLKGIQERLEKWQGSLKINSVKGCEIDIFISQEALDNAPSLDN